MLGHGSTLTSLPEDQPQTWRLCEAVRRILGADGTVITVEYLSPRERRSARPATSPAHSSSHAYALETDIAEVARQVVDREIN
jgi:hypothetical protein